jgi:hypothetical protein
MKQIMLTVFLSLAGICAFALICRFPAAACAAWMLALETSPDSWLARLIGGHATIIAVMKALGLLLVAALALRAGLRRDRYNPAFAFFLMFCAGLIHGLYPGLSLLGSVRSLFGSTAPFLFSFLRLPGPVVCAVKAPPLPGPRSPSVSASCWRSPGSITCTKSNKAPCGSARPASRLFSPALL